MKVLIVDDSRTARLKLRAVLREAGYDWLEIEEADSGEAAVEKARASRPDLVLTDVNMQGMDGFGVLKELGRAGLSADVGFVTAVRTPELDAAAIAAGAVLVLGKPYSVQAVCDVVGPHVTRGIVPVERWLDAGVAALQGISAKLFGIEGDELEVVERRFGDEVALAQWGGGPTIAAQSQRLELLLAVCGQPEHLLELALAMMSTAGPDALDEQLGADDVRDCLVEMLNVWGGAFRRSILWMDREVEIGMPSYSVEKIEVPAGLSVGAAEAKLRGATVQLVVAGRVLSG